jgi:hypothetical protein
MSEYFHLNGRTVLEYANVAHELTREILDRSEGATSNDFAVQARKPDLYLIEPGRISGREVQLRVGFRWRNSST